MKNKVINIVIFVLSIFFINNTNVFALNPVSISVHDIESDTYVIGTHMFNTNRTYLSTEDIMWAARTIDAESKDDMIIYYKDFNNKWINGRTGEIITTPSTFEIEEINGEKATTTSIMYVENNENYSIIDSDFYNETGLMITKDSDKDYTIYFNAYNFENATYDFNFVCKTDDETNLDLGTIPTTMEVLNGEFALPITVNKDAAEGYYSCEMTLDNNMYSYYSINVGEAKPIAKVTSLDIESFALDQNGEEIYGGAGSLEAINDNEYYYSKFSDNEYFNLYIHFNTHFMTEGNHTFDLKISDENNENVSELFEFPSNINVTYNSYNGKYGAYASTNPVNDSVESGKYKFDIYIDDEWQDTIYFIVQEPTEIKLESLYDKTNEYQITEDNMITSESKKEYTATFKTVGIEDGTYNINLNKIHYNNEQGYKEVDFEIKYNQSIKIQDNKFTLDFVVPKNIEIGNYYFGFELNTIKNIYIRSFSINLNVISNNSTALQLTQNKDICSESYYCGDSYIFGRNEENKDAKIKLHFATKGHVDGFEIYSSDEKYGTYSLLGNTEDIYHAEIENEQSFGNYDVYVPATQTKYYKVKPYILGENNIKTYKDESNDISYTDMISSFISFKMTNDYSEVEAKYDEEFNATITIESGIYGYQYADGYIIEEKTNDGDYSLLKEYKVNENINFDDNTNVSKESLEVTILRSATKTFKITPYVVSNGTKIYGLSMNKFYQNSFGFYLNTLYNNTDDVKVKDNIVEDIILTSEKDKSYTASFNAYGIPDGTYKFNNYIDISSGLEPNKIVLVENATVEVKDQKFTFDFVIPKDFKIGSHFIQFELLNQDDEILSMNGMHFKILSNTTTILQLSKNPDVDYPTNIFERNETTGDGTIELSFSAKGYVDGFEIYSGNDDYSFTLLDEIDGDFYQATNDNERSYTSIRTEIPFQKTLYYKVKPYIKNGEEKEYKDESNIISYTDDMKMGYDYRFRIKSDNNQNPQVTYDDENNATITLVASIKKHTLISGYEILYYDNEDFNGYILIDDIPINFENVTVNEYVQEHTVVVPSKKTYMYAIKPYLIISGEKVYEDKNYGVEYKNEK